MLGILSRSVDVPVPLYLIFKKLQYNFLYHLFNIYFCILYSNKIDYSQNMICHVILCIFGVLTVYTRTVQQKHV